MTELGDKTQLSELSGTSSWSVISPRTLQRVAGVLFLVIGG